MKIFCALILAALAPAAHAGNYAIENMAASGGTVVALPEAAGIESMDALGAAEPALAERIGEIQELAGPDAGEMIVFRSANPDLRAQPAIAIPRQALAGRRIYAHVLGLNGSAARHPPVFEFALRAYGELAARIEGGGAEAGRAYLQTIMDGADRDHEALRSHFEDFAAPDNVWGNRWREPQAFKVLGRPYADGDWVKQRAERVRRPGFQAAGEAYTLYGALKIASQGVGFQTQASLADVHDVLPEFLLALINGDLRPMAETDRHAYFLPAAYVFARLDRAHRHHLIENRHWTTVASQSGIPINIFHEQDVRELWDLTERGVLNLGVAVGRMFIDGVRKIERRRSRPRWS